MVNPDRYDALRCWHMLTIDDVRHAAASAGAGRARLVGLGAKASKPCCNAASVSMRGGEPLQMRWIWERLTPLASASCPVCTLAASIARFSQRGS